MSVFFRKKVNIKYLNTQCSLWNHILFSRVSHRKKSGHGASHEILAVKKMPITHFLTTCDLSLDFVFI